jgi:hypothetical protein
MVLEPVTVRCCVMSDDWETTIFQQQDGRWSYRLIPVGDPTRWESNGQSYLTREDAAWAARLAMAAKLLREK